MIPRNKELELKSVGYADVVMKMTSIIVTNTMKY